MISCVVFDLDGTLVEFPLVHLFSTAKRVFVDLGIEPVSDAELARYFSEFNFFGAAPAEQRAACAELLARELERVGHPRLQPFPETRTVLAALKQRGYRLAIATARVVSSEELLASLREVDLEQYFDCVATRNPASLEWMEKSPQLDTICRILGLRPAQLCFVGDIPPDVLSAQHYGAGLCVATLTGGILRDLLTETMPDHVIESLTELLPILPPR